MKSTRIELITGISILAVLEYIKKLEISKCLLIEPLLSYSAVLGILKRKTSKIRSLEELILKEKVVFCDFNSRFYEYLLSSINAIMLFKNMGLIQEKEGYLERTSAEFDLFNMTLGNKVKERIQASEKLADVLSKGEASDLYLCLRIEL